MVNRYWVLAAVLVLAGCDTSSNGGRQPQAKPGQSITYQQVLEEKVRDFVEEQRPRPAPEDRENAFVACAAKAMMDDLNQSQVNRLNAHARGESTARPVDLDAMGMEPRTRYRDLKAMIADLRYDCPDAIAGVRIYWPMR